MSLHTSPYSRASLQDRQTRFRKYNKRQKRREEIRTALGGCLVIMGVLLANAAILAGAVWIVAKVWQSVNG